MHKPMRTVVPTAQVLGFVTIFLFARLSHTDTAYFNYYVPAKSIMTQLNFPLWVLWVPIVYLFERSNGHLPPLNGIAFNAAALLLAAIFLSSVALFWYFVVREIEMRKTGKSFLRFSLWSKQLFATVILLCLGVGALFALYSEARPLWYVSTREAVLRGFFLVIWAIIFIGTAIYDLAAVLRSKTTRVAAP